MPATVELDTACAEAVDLARAAAVRRAGVFGVGEHRGVTADGVRVATHYFAVDHPAYPGWNWAVTVARASRGRVVTVNEVTMVPSDGALLAAPWVPWADRISGGDITPGALLPTPADDVRLEPGYTGGEDASDPDPAESSQIRAVVAELGLGRERVLSPVGRDLAAERWIAGDGGPDNPMTQQAPALCETCGYFLPLQGRLGEVFGVCANEFSPSDGRVISRDHGCGGHSDVGEPRRGVDLGQPMWDTITTDEFLFD
ncbi:MAG: DUF3027 domain-containing protein [Propionicimonas sp.]|nr:DUF3027 domain-containing protein [Propionicimonas sp.]MEA4942911.1 DUF3027 domain-containing protein [Propionicimonas sp.]